MLELMQRCWNVIAADFAEFPALEQAAHLAFRMTLAAVLGGLVGLQRERRGKAAGLRTHMLVSLGAALFVLVPQQIGANDADMSRIIQGVVAGIGFLGGGAIVKMSDRNEIHGLTTAAGIWLTAAIGIAAGWGRAWSAIFATVLALIIITIVGALEHWIEGKKSHKG